MRFLSLRHRDGSPIAFAEAWELQKELVEKRARGEIEDTFLFLEHSSVVTRGRGLQWTGAPRDRAMPLPPLPPGMDYFEIERGGDLTWHGPGQLVLYPIVRLDGEGFSEKHDVTAFLRRLERATIALHAAFGLKAEARESATGVWVGDRKTTSIGIAIRKWVTYHGAAVNVVNPLEPYRLFSPCGFESEVMASLKDLTDIPNDWRDLLENAWTQALAQESLRGIATADLAIQLTWL